MSTTPRTDANERSRDFGGDVSASFARQLETELAAVQKRLADSQHCRAKLNDELAAMDSELAAERAKVAELTTQAKSHSEDADYFHQQSTALRFDRGDVIKELDDAKQLIAELVAALTQCRDCRPPQKWQADIIDAAIAKASMGGATP